MTVVGIDQGESTEAVATFAHKFAIPYPVLLDGHQVLSALFLMQQLPFTIIVDVRGGVAKTVLGAMSFDRMVTEASRIGLARGTLN